MEIKKNLVVFFGELRTFKSCIHHFKDLSNFDLILATWDVSTEWRDGGRERIRTKVSQEMIDECFSNIKCIISSEKDKYKFNTTNIIYHFKNAINSIDINKYKNIILHRCDLISRFDEIDFSKIEEDVLYCEPGHTDESGFWMNDYIFLGSSSIIKKFVDFLNLVDYPYAHYPFGNSILNNKIKYKNINELFSIPSYLSPILVRPHAEEYLNKLTKDNLKYFNLTSENEYRPPEYFYR